MDGPQVRRMTGRHETRLLVKCLAELEMRFYERIMPPDVLVVLKLDPEIAVRRKTDENPTSVRTRTAQVWQLDWGNTSAHVIDASQSRADVLSDIKNVVWSQL
jgi:thymidylate kinase